MTQKTKNVALEKFLEQTTLKPCDFWAREALGARRRDCLKITVSHPGSKVAGFVGGLFQKLFKGYIFCFLGDSVGRCIFEQFARETNLKKKRSVRMRWYSTQTNTDLNLFFRKVHVHYCFCRGIIFWCQRNLLLAALEILIACGNGMPIYHTHFTVQCNQNIMWNVFGWYLHFYSYGLISYLHWVYLI